MQLNQLNTPALIANRRALETNASRMRERALAHGMSLRPHLKTTKSAAIARIAHGGKVGPGTVSTLQEAEYFFARGFTDLTYAVCITPNKFERAAALIDHGADLKLLVADVTTAAALVEYSRRHSTRVSVMIEVDCGDHRTGLLPGDPQLVAVARILNEAPDVSLRGLLTHGGHSYRCRNRHEVQVVAEEERTALLDAKAKLTTLGIDDPVLSSGSTPTAVFGESFTGLSELRPGVYLAGDLFQAGLGVCSQEDIALSVLASVIAVDSAQDRMVIDAGALALSKDTSRASGARDLGFGLVANEDGRMSASVGIVTSVSQEHGVVTPLVDGATLRYQVGQRVRVLPNHACMTAASYERYYVVDGHDTNIVDEWDKASGW